MNSDGAIRVFVSYSWDSPSHCDAVRMLVDRLRKDGIECTLDQYQFPPPPEGWATWMHDQVKIADFVLVICSNGYSQKAERRTPVSGTGVRFESLQVLQELYDANMVNRRYLPVLLEPGSVQTVWEPLRPYHRYIVSTEHGYEELYRTLTGQPHRKPPTVGRVKELSTEDSTSTGFVGQTEGAILSGDWNQARRSLDSLLVWQPNDPRVQCLGALSLIAGRNLAELPEGTLGRVERHLVESRRLDSRAPLPECLLAAIAVDCYLSRGLPSPIKEPEAAFRRSAAQVVEHEIDRLLLHTVRTSDYLRGLIKSDLRGFDQ